MRILHTRNSPISISLILTYSIFAILSMSGIFLSSLSSEQNSFQENRNIVLTYAREYFNTPYLYGGTSGSGFDCSGFTSHIYRKIGVTLPRRSLDQYNLLPGVEKPDPGDLVFFKIDGEKISHVGIYTGEGKFIHAPSSGKKIRYSSLKNSYWKKRYAGARTVFSK